MDQVRFFATPKLRNPVLIAAFAGWNDAAQSATSAVRFLLRQWSARKFAEIDPEEYFDFTEIRPTVRIVDGAVRKVEWPTTEMFFHSDPGKTRDYVLLLGTEPQLRWRNFVRQILTICRQHDVQTIVTAGAMIADVLHSTPVKIIGFSSNHAMNARLERLGALPSSYEGPTGITGVLTAIAREEGLDTASLWGSVPMYISAIPNPKVKLGLLQRLDGMLDLNLYLDEIEETSRQFDRQVTEAIASNPEIARYVQQLETKEASASIPPTPSQPVQGLPEPPSGESLVEDIEAFLRRHRLQEGDQ